MIGLIDHGEIFLFKNKKLILTCLFNCHFFISLLRNHLNLNTFSVRNHLNPNSIIISINEMKHTHIVIGLTYKVIIIVLGLTWKKIITIVLGLSCKATKNTRNTKEEDEESYKKGGQNSQYLALVLIHYVPCT